MITVTNIQGDITVIIAAQDAIPSIELIIPASVVYILFAAPLVVLASESALLYFRLISGSSVF